MTNLDSIFKSRDITLPTKVRLVKAMVFPMVHVWMWELDCEEGWVPNNWCFWTVVLEKTLESPLDCKEIWPVHSEGDHPWDFFGRNDVEAETPVLWPRHVKSWLTGKDWCWEGLGAGGKGDDRGWDGWITSLSRWTWVWVKSGSWWWTGRPGVLPFMGSQRVGHDWATELTDWLTLTTIFSTLKWLKIIYCITILCILYVNFLHETLPYKYPLVSVNVVATFSVGLLSIGRLSKNT